MKQPSPEPLSGHHKYEKLSELGSGSFGVVQLARNRYTEKLPNLAFTCLIPELGQLQECGVAIGRFSDRLADHWQADGRSGGNKVPAQRSSRYHKACCPRNPGAQQLLPPARGAGKPTA